MHPSWLQNRLKSLLKLSFAIPICISFEISIVIFSSGWISNRKFSSSSSYPLSPASPSESPGNNSKPSMLFDLLMPFGGIKPLITSFYVFEHGVLMNSCLNNLCQKQNSLLCNLIHLKPLLIRKQIQHFNSSNSFMFSSLQTWVDKVTCSLDKWLFSLIKVSCYLNDKITRNLLSFLQSKYLQFNLEQSKYIWIISYMGNAVFSGNTKAFIKEC